MPQFLLTQEERDALVYRSELEAAVKSIKAMAPLIARLSPKQGGCIHDGGPHRNMGYCDYCPAAELGCLLEKNWSK